jgi:antirestriction protein ArdC
MAKFSIYDMVTDRHIESLEKNIVPWAKPWVGGGLPMNLTTKKTYRGVNVFLLSMMDFESPYWVTRKQALSLGGKISTSQSPTPIVFWKRPETDEKTGLIKKWGFYLYYKVWNVAQTEGFKYPKHETLEQFEDLMDCEKITENMPDVPEIVFGGKRACYNKKDDIIKMPEKLQFETEAGFYATKFHELIHSTGHTKRLNREEMMQAKGNIFGGDDYSKEELTAELGASFLTAMTGVGEKVFDNQNAYIKNWLKELRNDKRLILSAASKAQKAVDYIVNRTF